MSRLPDHPAPAAPASASAGTSNPRWLTPVALALAAVAVGYAIHIRDGEYTPEALLSVLRRALALFRNQRAWRELQLAGMEADHSWDRSAREYVKIYDWAVSKGEMNGRGQRADVYGR